MSALVVGGHGAIGSAVVSLLRHDGADVHVLDRSTGVDAADPDQVRAFLDTLSAPVTQLAHVAGTVGQGGLLDTGLDEWRSIVDDNLTSAYVTCREVVPGMLAAGGGSIVLMSSVNGRHGGNTLSGPAYAAAKAGVIGLARNLAKEFGSQGVRINAVAPGPVASAMTDRLSADELRALVDTVPAGRAAEPEEVARVIAFLLDDTVAGYVTGATVDVNGGMWTG